MTMHDFYDDLADEFAEDWTADETDWTTDDVDEAGSADFPDTGHDLARLRVADALRQTMREEFAGASDEEMEFALDSVLESMSAAEGFNFGQALSQIGRSAGQALSDPTVSAIARTALPIAGGALGTVIGGPVGTALGTQLGSLAAGALPTQPAPRAPAAPRPGVVLAPPAAAPSAGPVALPGAAASPVAGGSAAAAQGLVLTQQPQVLQSLLATALGQYGRGQVGGVPNAQLLGMLSQVFGRAAADADELMYLGGADSDEEEAVFDDLSADGQALYTSLVDADNLEVAGAFESEEVGA